MQLHTQLVRNAHGQLIEVCSINGIRTVAIGNGEFFPATDPAPDNERSAAMALSDLMSEAAAHPVNIEHPESGPINIGIQPVTEELHSLFPYGLRPIRAPPVV